MKLELGECYNGYLYSKNGFLYVQQMFQLPALQNYNTPIFKSTVELRVMMTDGRRNLVRLNKDSSNINIDCYESCEEGPILTLLDSSGNLIFYFTDKFEHFIPIITDTTINIIYEMNNQIQYYQRELSKLRENKDVVSENKKLS